MNLNVPDYVRALAEHNITVMYSGPVWAGGLEGLSNMLQRRFDLEHMPLEASQSVFSVFVEQMNNLLMYSAEKEQFTNECGELSEVSKGIFILGVREKTYFIYTGNVVSDSSAEILKKRIDHLNTLEGKELRKYYRQCLNAGDDNPESKGAGLGLIEIARRATSKIEYEFSKHDSGKKYFTMYVEL
jgi:hypothetical protein